MSAARPEPHQREQTALAAAPLPPRARRGGLRQLLQLTLALGVTVAFAAIVSQRVDLSELTGHLEALGPGRALLGAAVVALTVLLRAARLCRCLGERPSVDLASASIVHNALVAILPAKLGEFALPAMLSRLRGTEALGGLGILVAMRIYDLLALGVVGGAAAAVTFDGALRWSLLSAALACGLGLAWLPRMGPLFTVVAAREPTGGRLDALLRRISRAMGGFGGHSARQLSWLSLAIWASLFTSFWVFTGGSSRDWPSVAVEGAAGSLAFALPLSGVANLGPFQAAWVAASNLLGHPEQALVRALVAHGAVLVVTSALACVAGALLLIHGLKSPETRS